MENIRISVLQMPVHQLVHHPDNPRKEFGDLSELTESIRKKGIMQNLTIIPVECRELPVEQQPNINEINMNGEFLVLIGNRRMEAAKQAGVEKLPCRIVTGLSKKDQIAVMLEENMQRNDLSISEQANSFQLMLNLGDTVDGIQEKHNLPQTEYCKTGSGDSRGESERRELSVEFWGYVCVRED